MKTYTPTEQRNVMEHVASAFIALRDGSNDRGDFNTLAGAINVGLVRSEALDRATEEVFQHAQQAMLRADQVYGSLRVYIFTPADLIDMAKAVQAFAEILRSTSDAAMKSVLAECDRRLAAWMHGRVHGSTH